MATKPKITTLVKNSADILNAIRNNATVNYRDYVPVATQDAESIREIGATIMAHLSLQNEFLTALVNRIGRVVITSRFYENPWAFAKKGILEFGETIEEIFVNIATVYEFDPEEAENTLYKREIPDVRSAFHTMNYRKVYPTTISDNQLRQAFLSWDGIVDLISKIVESMYTAANYDEFQTMKYMVAKRILNGMLYPVSVPNPTAETAKSVVATMKAVSNDLTFLSDKYNVAGVYNNTAKENQYFLINSRFDATMDVEVLASAFNMDKADFMGRRVLVDGFGNLDIKRLSKLFEGDPTYTEFSEEELEALNAIPAVIVDGDWFMIFDNMIEFTEAYNGKGLYWNYFYHAWKTFSVSPFANSVLFVPGTPDVTEITVSPANATIGIGQSGSFVANVSTEYFAPQSVNWTVDNEFATVDKSGVVNILDGASGTIKVKATSVFNAEVSGEATITVG